jgi:hypothetical protein
MRADDAEVEPVTLLAVEAPEPDALALAERLAAQVAKAVEERNSERAYRQQVEAELAHVLAALGTARGRLAAIRDMAHVMVVSAHTTSSDTSAAGISYLGRLAADGLEES